MNARNFLTSNQKENSQQILRESKYSHLRKITLPVFKLEEYFSQWEFKTPYLFCCSDAESWSLTEILSFADEELKVLWDNLQLGYTEIPGLPNLRQEITKLYSNIKPENVLCFAGAEDAIFCTMWALLQPQDHVIVVTPCYQSLETLPRHIGARVTSIALEETNQWKLDFNKLHDAITHETRMIIVNFPHNPTGTILEDTATEKLVRIAQEHEIYIFADEVYRLLGPSSTKWSDPIATLYEHGISLGVMSKAFGLAGLRIGWIVCQEAEVLKKLELFKHYTSICNSAPSEILALTALRAKEQILARNCAIVDSNLEKLDDFFERYKDLFSWVRPRGGCVGFVCFHSHSSIDEFAQQLVEKMRVLIVPGRVYECSGNYFRIGFGQSNMPEVLNRFELFVKEWIT